MAEIVGDLSFYLFAEFGRMLNRELVDNGTRRKEQCEITLAVVGRVALRIRYRVGVAHG